MMSLCGGGKNPIKKKNSNNQYCQCLIERVPKRYRNQELSFITADFCRLRKLERNSILCSDICNVTEFLSPSQIGVAAESSLFSDAIGYIRANFNAILKNVSFHLPIKTVTTRDGKFIRVLRVLQDDNFVYYRVRYRLKI